MSQSDLAAYVDRRSPGVFDTTVLNHEELVSVSLSLMESEAVAAEEEAAASAAAIAENAETDEEVAFFEAAHAAHASRERAEAAEGDEAEAEAILLPSADMVAEEATAAAAAAINNADSDPPLAEWQEELLTEFLEICPGCELASARHMLEACAFEMDAAMVMFMENPPPTVPAAPSSSSSGPAGPRPPLAPMGGSGASPPPSMRMPGFGLGGGYDSSDEDNYGGVEQYDEFGVRRPDRVRRQRLNQGSPRHGGPGSGSGMGNDYEEALARAEEEGVEWMFPPPAALNFVGSLEQCREQGKVDGKWVLANLQDHAEFASHMLNRDTWMDDMVEQVVRSNFLFWQRGTTSRAGKAYKDMYRLGGDDEKFPHMAIIDPRTGAKVATFSGYVEPLDMTQKLVVFLERHSLTAHKIPTPAKEQAAAVAGTGADTDVEIAAEWAVGKADGGVQTDPEPEPLRADYGTAAEEPVAGPDVCRVQLKFPSGKTLVRRFYKAASLRELYAVAAASDAIAAAGTGTPFELNTTYPVKTLDPAGGSVQDEGVAGAQVLVRLL